MIRHNPSLGQTIDQVAGELVDVANERNEEVEGYVGEIRLIARPGQDPQTIVDYYHEKTEMSRPRQTVV